MILGCAEGIANADKGRTDKDFCGTRCGACGQCSDQFAAFTWAEVHFPVTGDERFTCHGAILMRVKVASVSVTNVPRRESTISNEYRGGEQ